MSHKPKRDIAEIILYTLSAIGGLFLALCIGLFLLSPGAFIAGFKRGLNKATQKTSASQESRQAFAEIKRQAEPCWQPPTQNKGYVAHILVAFNADGTVASHKISKKSMQDVVQDSDYSHYVMTALNIFTDPRCFPLKKVPTAPHSEWKRIEFVFTEDTVQ